MSPSRGIAAEEQVSEEVRNARAALRRLLAGLHVLDVLPERSRMLAVDAELPVHGVLATVVSEQHPRPQAAQAPRAGGPRRAGGLPGSPRGGSEDRWADARGGGGRQTDDGSGALMRREGSVAASEELPGAAPLCCGFPPPSLPSNVLAEVCEFDPASPQGDAAREPAAEEKAEESQPAVRRWTSPDDGWGMQQPMQDLEKMPMGMPVTVGEIADFLISACTESAAGAPGEGKNASQEAGSLWRWMDSSSTGDVKSGGKAGEKGDPALAGDMLDWSLAQWRAHRLKMYGAKDSKDTGPSADTDEPQTRIFVEELSVVGPVLVHRVPPAPPRPILCTDNPEASLLKAVQLLLAYPELDALPIVSIVRCTVVAHLTLSYCLAYMLSRLRGTELLPLSELPVCGSGGGNGGVPAQRLYDSAVAAGSSEAWAERKHPATAPSAAMAAAPPSPPWVLSRSQPMRELLMFFARSHHTGVPIVEDGADGGVLGYISRRDFLQFLDLAMQSAARRSEDGGVASGCEGDATSGDTEEKPGQDEDIVFDILAPVEVILNTLRRYRVRDEVPAEPRFTAPTPDLLRQHELTLAASGTLHPDSKKSKKMEERERTTGAGLVFEKELALSRIMLRVLDADNRKLLFVKEAASESDAPKLLRLLSVSDVWLQLLGSDVGESETVTPA